MQKDNITEEQKQSLIDYMVKHCGFTPHNARRRFEKWESKRIENREKQSELINGMTIGEIETMVIYMYRCNYTNWWIANCLNIPIQRVKKIIFNHRKSL